jgi:hypothetical protein
VGIRIDPQRVRFGVEHVGQLHQVAAVIAQRLGDDLISAAVGRIITSLQDFNRSYRESR